MFCLPNRPIAQSCRSNYSGRERTHASFPGSTLFGVASLVLALVCATAAQQQEPPASSSSGTWRMSGKVVDARSGQALARCVVGISPSQERTQSVSAVTGEDGQFVFAGLESGKYRLTAARRGYLTQSYQQHESFSTAIAVGPNLKSEGLIFNLMPQAVFYGVVTDETGEPIRGAQVRLFEDQGRGGLRSIQGRKMARTDDRGMYEIADISPANYFLAVSAQAWYAQQLRRPAPANTQGELDSSLDVAYPTTYYPAVTDSDEATPIPVKGGERIQVDMTLTAQHAMHLRLPLPQDRLGGYGVSLMQSVFGESEQVPTGMQVLKDGFMEIEGVIPGRYDVTVTQFAAGPQPASTHFTADVAAGTTELREESGAGEATVTGKVISLESKIPSGSMALVSLHPRREYTAEINQAGEFSMKVPEGEYEIVGRIPQNYLAAVSSPNALVKGRMLQVKADAAAKLQIVAGTGYGQIDGWAELAGQRVSGVMILLAPEDAKDNHILFRRDQSDSDGSFSLLRIIPGRYRLLAIANGWDLEWADPKVLDAFQKKSIPIVIHANEKLKDTVEVQSW
jgi:hypothetical protein